MKISPAIPETNKKPGIYQALTDDGLELPVVDVTHPAFAVDPGEGEANRLLQDYQRNTKRQGVLSRLLQPLLLRLMSRRSVIMRGIMAAAGGFMSGMDTYLLKLGPANLGSFANDIDRQIAGSISGLAMRLRLQDLAYLLADGLFPALSSAVRVPLHLLNIGGGPAVDSLNALIILQKRDPRLLAERAVFVHVLDLDESGPHFGSRALTALQSDGAPLHGVDARFERIAYNWSEPAVLAGLLKTFQDVPAVVAASSEGALFEYGSDQDIAGNLRAFYEGTPPDAIVAGSLTRADATGRFLNSSSRAAIQLRGPDAFLALIQPAGWRLAQRIDRPMSHDLLLRKAVQPQAPSAWHYNDRESRSLSDLGEAASMMDSVEDDQTPNSREVGSRWLAKCAVSNRLVAVRADASAGGL